MFRIKKADPTNIGTNNMGITNEHQIVIVVRNWNNIKLKMLNPFIDTNSATNQVLEIQINHRTKSTNKNKNRINTTINNNNIIKCSASNEICIKNIEKTSCHT